MWCLQLLFNIYKYQYNIVYNTAHTNNNNNTHLHKMCELMLGIVNDILLRENSTLLVEQCNA